MSKYGDADLFFGLAAPEKYWVADYYLPDVTEFVVLTTKDGARL